jgi:hypothetical protein
MKLSESMLCQFFFEPILIDQFIDRFKWSLIRIMFIEELIDLFASQIAIFTCDADTEEQELFEFFVGTIVIDVVVNHVY